MFSLRGNSASKRRRSGTLLLRLVLRMPHLASNGALAKRLAKWGGVVVASSLGASPIAASICKGFLHAAQ